MKTLPFKSSAEVSIGVELEYQIIDSITYDLISRAKELMRSIQESPFQTRIKPEITQSMIEINSSIHHSPQEMHKEFMQIKNFLREEAEKIGIYFCGGGTHPFQKWTARKIFPSKRFKNKSRQYRYLSKQSTVFGQHIHVGCKSGEDALYLTHAFARYVPQLIAINASSPFYQSVDTGFVSSRSHVFNAFPTSGTIPYLENWQIFSNYFYMMKKLGVIEGMKDIYWDIRPKPEFGTVEIRVADTPLTIKKAVMLAAYVQSLAHYLLTNKRNELTHNLYYLYNVNRFQATRYGFEGVFVNPYTSKSLSIADDIIETIAAIKESTKHLDNGHFIDELQELVMNNTNDASQLRSIYKEVASFPKLVQEQCMIWNKNT